jgi:hypothetical protein
LSFGSFVRAKCSQKMIVVFAIIIARTARNCSHQKPNDTKCESKILRLT